MENENKVTEESSIDKFVNTALPIMRKNVYDKIENIKKILNYLEVDEEISNVAITLNNKFGEIYRRFKKCGATICTDSVEIADNEDMQHGYVGNAIINDLINRCLNGIGQLDDVQAGCKNAGISRRKRVLGEFGNSGFKKILYGIRPKKFNKVLEQKKKLTEDEKKMINIPLDKYKEIEQEIFEYDIDKEIIQCLVKYFIQNNRVVHYGKTIYNFQSENFERTFEKYIVPDMKLLGMEKIIPEAKCEIMRVADKIEGKKVKMESVAISREKENLDNVNYEI